MKMSRSIIPNKKFFLLGKTSSSLTTPNLESQFPILIKYLESQALFFPETTKVMDTYGAPSDEILDKDLTPESCKNII